MTPFFGLSDVRIALWNSVADLCQSTCATGPDRIPALQARLTELRSIERYWGYPGIDVMRLIDTYLTQGNWNSLNQLIFRVRESLKSGDYETREWTPLQAIVEQLDRP